MKTIEIGLGVEDGHSSKGRGCSFPCSLLFCLAQRQVASTCIDVLFEARVGKCLLRSVLGPSSLHSRDKKK